MAQGAQAKRDRLQLRVDSHDKAVLQRAAEYRRESVSRFVLSSALSTAERVIREHEVETLSSSDWQVFFDALVDPPRPNETLKAAFRRYRQASK